MYTSSPATAAIDCICDYKRPKVLKTIKKLRESQHRSTSTPYTIRTNLDRLINELLLQFQIFFFLSLSLFLFLSFQILSRSSIFLCQLNREQMLYAIFYVIHCAVNMERMRCNWRSTIAYYYYLNVRATLKCDYLSISNVHNGMLSSHFCQHEAPI